MLIILSGLPGTGKSTIARALAQRLQAVHVRVDTIEQVLRASGRLTSDLGPAGYMAAYGVAEDNLRLGRAVIADSVNPLRITREAWRAVAERAAVPVAEIEVICSDEAEHRRRVETRQTDIEGLILPRWQDVVDRVYEPWDRPVTVIDTAAKGVEGGVAEIIAALPL